MKVTILKEEGYEMALRGMAYSFKDRALPVEDWWAESKERAEKRAPLLAPKDGGHNKFLESIVLWVDVEAPRAFWSEFDTYRVGTTKQSESSMHTLAKRRPTIEDFEEGTHEMVICSFQRVWDFAKGDVTTLKMNLPEGFLQRRLVCTNYKVIRNILWQRGSHRLKQWPMFCEAIRQQSQHPEFLTLS